MRPGALWQTARPITAVRYRTSRTPAQFVDLNAHIGGADIDLNPVPQRRVADQPALSNAYRTGLINAANNLNQTAIIDCRGPNRGSRTTHTVRSLFARGLIGTSAPMPTR